MSTHTEHEPRPAPAQAGHDCCHTPPPQDTGTWRLARQTTAHCMTGCAIGDFLGLFIGVSLGLGLWKTIALDTALAFLFGFLLTLIPMVRGRGMTVLGALKVVWLGEVVSIGVMEAAMNGADYAFGGMTMGTVWHWQFWAGFLISLPAGYLAALPVNYAMIRTHIKGPHCH